MMAVGSETVLFAGFRSDSIAATLAVLVSGPGVSAFTAMATAAVAPLANVPNVHVTVLVPAQLPWPAAAETNVTPAGSVSVSVTPVASPAPLLLTVRLYVTALPTGIGSRLSVIASARSMPGCRTDRDTV